MTLKRLLLLPLLMVAIGLAGLAPAGCGDDAEGGGDETNQPSQAYTDLLTGLEAAARSESSFKAGSKANEFNVPEEAVVDAFCETAWQLEINSELDRLARYGYMVGRIRNLAEYDLNGKYKAEVGAAMAVLLKTVDLRSLDGKLVHGYKKACYQ